jgi:hypothetical protein
MKVMIDVTDNKLPKSEITISPFIMSMVAENPIPADYDYKADYENYLSEKYK